MKKLTFLTWACFLSLTLGCEKNDENNLADENYIQCHINGEPFVVYENNSLNKEDTTSTFSFSFGTTVHTGLTDTVFNVGGTLHRNAISLSFPWTSHPQKFSIYRTQLNIPDAQGSYQYVAKYINNGKLTVFHTKNYTKDDNLKTEVVGEIVINYADPGRQEFRGTFWFKAFGYQFPLSHGGYVTPSNEIMEITKGHFHYRKKN